MLGWLDDITKLTLGNSNFRTVAYTGEHTQLTLMRLGPGEEIGWERHGHLDQFLRLEHGRARVEFGANRACRRRDPRGRGRLGVHRAGRRVAQRGQHRSTTR